MGRPRTFDETEVVQRAAELFMEKGYQRTTPQDLLVATGLSKSSLYATFGSKQGLFERALGHYVEHQVDALGEMLDQGTLREGLERMYAMIISMSTDDEQPRSCMICTASLEADPQDTELVALVASSGARVLATITARIERAQRDGEVDPRKDAGALAHVIYTQNMGLVVLARSGTPAEALHAATDQVIASICA